MPSGPPHEREQREQRNLRSPTARAGAPATGVSRRGLDAATRAVAHETRATVGGRRAAIAAGAVRAARVLTTLGGRTVPADALSTIGAAARVDCNALGRHAREAIRTLCVSSTRGAASGEIASIGDARRRGRRPARARAVTIRRCGEHRPRARARLAKCRRADEGDALGAIAAAIAGEPGADRAPGRAGRAGTMGRAADRTAGPGRLGTIAGLALLIARAVAAGAVDTEPTQTPAGARARCACHSLRPARTSLAKSIGIAVAVASARCAARAGNALIRRTRRARTADPSPIDRRTTTDLPE